LKGDNILLVIIGRMQSSKQMTMNIHRRNESDMIQEAQTTSYCSKTIDTLSNH